MRDLTLVIDIGKSNAKLLLVDRKGTVVERYSRANVSVMSPLGYLALDVQGLTQWMKSVLKASALAMHCARVIASTHGAAVVGLSDDGLAWDPLDYEFDPFAGSPSMADAFLAASDGFADTLSPDLPAGLNAARQLFWMQSTHAPAWRATRCLVPYAQYWAWLLSGQVASEVSSLGCHTHLWLPQHGEFSALASTMGWAALFAPMRSAWEVLGTIDQRASDWSLPAHCEVHVGVHDSNACLARYLNPQSVLETQNRTTVVSSGTWTVLMAPGAPPASLVARQDMLGNVDVTGRVTPTARFMGGREYDFLLDGAQADAIEVDSVQRIVMSRIYAMPAFSRQGGPFSGHRGHVEWEGRLLGGAPSQHLDASTRSALAAMYCAQVTTWLIGRLWAQAEEIGNIEKPVASDTIIVDGPLSHNAVYLRVLQSLNPARHCFASRDDLEGTARGAWLLANWTTRQSASYLAASVTKPIAGLDSYHATWLQKLAHGTTSV